MKIKIQSKHENQMEVKKSPTIIQSIELCFIHFVHCVVHVVGSCVVHVVEVGVDDGSEHWDGNANREKYTNSW